MKDNTYILKLVEDAFINKLPLSQVSEHEMGELIGQQQVVNFIREKLKVTLEKEQEIK